MKPYKILIFILSSFFLLAVLGFVFPSEGLKVGSVHLRFPSINEIVAVDDEVFLDVDKNIHEMQSKSDMQDVQTTIDSLRYYKNYVRSDVTRLHFPNANYKFFDRLFAIMELAKKGKPVHIMHYGDSQIEMDRISSIFRQRLQEEFGGIGAGIVPPIQTIPTFTISQSYSGDLQRFVVYGDTSQPRASHRRYGLLATFAQVYSNATISVGARSSRNAQEKAKSFQRLSVIVGNNQPNFTVVCRGQTKQIKQAKRGITLLTFDFAEPVSRTTITLNGMAEVYGISLSGKNGISVSNVPMRGSSGTIFTRIDSTTLSQSYQTLNVALIIMQFGGNMMPQIKGEKSINNYMNNIGRQIQYLKRVNPHAEILFVGPSDMAKRIDGKLQTYPYLPQLNEALKNTVLANNAAYWDMFNVMGGENSMTQWVKHSPPWAGPDHIHFTEAGANQISIVLANTFLMHYNFYKLRKNQNPALIEKFMQLD